MKKNLVYLIICLLLTDLFAQNAFAATKKDVVKQIIQTKFEVKQGKKITLPSEVQILLRNGKKEYVSVKWDKYKNVVYAPGKYTFTGLIAKYNEREKFVVNVLLSKDKVREFEPIQIKDTVYVGDIIKLPEIAKVEYLTPGTPWVHYSDQSGTEKITWYPVLFGTISNNEFIAAKPGHYQLKYSINKLKEIQYINIHVLEKAAFENTALEAKLKDESKNTELTTEHLDNVTYLSIDTSKVTSLKDIDKLKNLETLYLNGTINLTPGDVSKLNTLSSLKNLRLSLSPSSTSVIPDLLKLKVTSLDLNIGDTFLDNLNGLRNCKFKEFNFSGYLTDYSALVDMQSKIKILWNYSNVQDGIAANNQKKKLKEQDDAVKNKIAKVVSQYITSGMDEKTKIQVIHDYIVNNAEYDYENFLSNTIPSESYSAYGNLILGKSVCAGYSKAFQLFMDAMGIECITVSGEANGIGGKGGHAWNIVKVNGEYKHVDTTWDDPIYTYNGVRKQVLRSDYFLISDDQIGKDHFWDKSKTPKCN
jgi:hypothetical protein